MTKTSNMKSKMKSTAKRVGKAVELVDFKAKHTLADYVSADNVLGWTRKIRGVSSLAGASAGGWIGYTAMTTGLAGLIASAPLVATTTAACAVTYGLLTYGGVSALNEGIINAVARRTRAERKLPSEVKKPATKSGKIRPEKIREAVMRSVS